MEKKNTMLLTVIAVATLLVAVVGATFAYFSLTMEGSTSTTNAQVTTAKVGTATLTGKNQNLALKVSANDMVKGEMDKTFYAKAGSVSEEESFHDESETPITIATAQVTGGEATDTYKCKATLKVTAEGDMLENLQAGWVTLKLAGEIISSGTTTLDLNDFKTEGTKSAGETIEGDFTLEGATSKDVTAVLSLVNKFETPQNAIAGKTLNVKIELTGGTCELQTE